MFVLIIKSEPNIGTISNELYSLQSELFVSYRGIYPCFNFKFTKLLPNISHLHGPTARVKN